MKYLLPIILFFACNSKQQQGQIKDECLSQSTLYLYSALNDDYIPLFNEWKIQLDSTDYYFTEDVKEVINTIKPLIDTLINQSGGIHPTDFILVNPCRQGGEVVTRIFNHEFNEKLKEKIEILKKKYQTDRYQRVINLFDNVLKNHFYGKNPFFNEAHVVNTSYSKLGLELLLVEQTLYLFIQKNLI